MTASPLPPGPRGRPLLGSLPDFNRDQLGFLLRMRQQYGDLVHYKLLIFDIYQVNHPDLIQEILVNQAERFQKGALDHQVFSQSLGQGLIISEGEFHRAQRKLMQPAFHHKRIERYGEIMTRQTAHMLEGWGEGAALDIHAAMTDLTMRIVAEALFNVQVGDAEGIGEAIHALNHEGEEQYKQGFVIPSWIPVPQNRRIRQAVTRVNALLLPIIAERRQSGEDTGDLLSMLLAAQDEDTGGRMTDQQVRDEVVTLFIAGHETTSNLLSWTLYALSQHPQVEARLHEEVDRVLGGRLPTLADLANLPYTDLVIKEALRLHPPAWVLNGRQALTDVTLGDYTLPAGSTCLLSPYVLHRDPRWFDEPERFWPERWADGLEKRLPRYAYFPFGGGARVCIGNSFALMEARLILAAIAARARLTLAPGARVEADPLITLRVKGGLPMRAALRLPEPA